VLGTRRLFNARTEAVVHFSSLERAETQPRPTRWASVELIGRQVLRGNNVSSLFHQRGLINLAHYKFVSWAGAKAELPRSWLVISPTVAAANTGPVHHVIVGEAIPQGRNYRLQDSLPWRQFAHKPFRLRFHSSDLGSVLIQEREEDDCNSRGGQEVPFPRTESSEDRAQKDCRDRSESGGDVGCRSSVRGKVKSVRE
jgi:hypothetical protein